MDRDGEQVQAGWVGRGEREEVVLTSNSRTRWVVDDKVKIKQKAR